MLCSRHRLLASPRLVAREAAPKERVRVIPRFRIPLLSYHHMDGGYAKLSCNKSCAQLFCLLSP
jgi:hypothetical protein